MQPVNVSEVQRPNHQALTCVLIDEFGMLLTQGKLDIVCTALNVVNSPLACTPLTRIFRHADVVGPRRIALKCRGKAVDAAKLLHECCWQLSAGEQRLIKRQATSAVPLLSIGVAVGIPTARSHFVRRRHRSLASPSTAAAKLSLPSILLVSRFSLQLSDLLVVESFVRPDLDTASMASCSAAGQYEAELLDTESASHCQDALAGNLPKVGRPDGGRIFSHLAAVEPLPPGNADNLGSAVEQLTRYLPGRPTWRTMRLRRILTQKGRCSIGSCGRA